MRLSGIGRLVAVVVFVICLGVSIERKALHITHGANVALIVVMVLAVLAALSSGDKDDE